MQEIIPHNEMNVTAVCVSPRGTRVGEVNAVPHGTRSGTPGPGTAADRVLAGGGIPPAPAGQAPQHAAGRAVPPHGPGR